MPLGPNVKYRTVRRGGKLIRLAFRGKKVIEAKEVEPAEPKSRQKKVKLRT